MKTPFLLLAAFFLGTSISHSQILFHKKYTDLSRFESKFLKVTPYGYVIGGDKLVKVDKDGKQMKIHRNIKNNGDYIPSDSGFVTARSEGVRSIAYVTRFDADGKQLWDQRFKKGIWRNTANSAISLKGGSFAYTGNFGSVTERGALLCKLDPNGKVVWEQTWGGETEHGREIIASDTTLFVLGATKAGLDGKTIVGRSMSLNAYGVEKGTRMWNYEYKSDSTTDATDLVVLDQEHVLMLAHTRSDLKTDGPRGLLVDLSGSTWPAKLNWEKHYPSPFHERFVSIERAPDSGYLILGVRGKQGVDSVKTFLMKVDTVGTKEWEYVFPNDDFNHIGTDLIHLEKSVYAMSGHYSDKKEIGDYFLTKFDITKLRASDPVGFAEATKDVSIELYPNPTNSWVRIDLKGSTKNSIDVVVRDITGRQIDRITDTGSSLQYDTSFLKPGTYLIETSITSGKKVVRLTVE